MMKRISTLSLIFLTVLFSRAQVSYPLVTIGPKYFTDGHEIYYLETTFQKKDGLTDVHTVNTQVSNNYCSKDTLAWIGNTKDVTGKRTAQIAVRNSVNFSEGKIGPYVVMPQGNKGSKYVALNLSPGKKVWSEIKEVRLERFLGVTDTVKTISFYMVSEPGAGIIPEENIIDSMFLKISKKYGIIETRVQDCIQQGGILRTTIGRLGNKVKIIGMPVEGLGWKPKLPHEFFNYKIGDKLYYHESNTQGMAMPCNTSGTVTIEILDKRVTRDSIIYKVKNWSQYQTVLCSAPVGFIYSGNHKIDTTIRINTWIAADGNREKSTLYYYIYPSRDSVMYRMDGCPNPMMYPRTSKYVLGKGLVLKTHQNGLGGEYRLNLRQYIIAGFPNYNSISEEYTVSPNPITDNMTITVLHNNSELSLIDASGKERLKVESLLSGENRIYLNNLEPGIYLYKILSGSKQVKSGKLIVQ